MSENDKLGQEPEWTQATSLRPTIGFFFSNLSDVRADDLWSGVVDAAREQGVNLVSVTAGNLQADDTSMRGVLRDLVGTESFDGLITFQWWPDQQAFDIVLGVIDGAVLVMLDQGHADFVASGLPGPLCAQLGVATVNNKGSPPTWDCVIVFARQPVQSC